MSSLNLNFNESIEQIKERPGIPLENEFDKDGYMDVYNFKGKVNYRAALEISLVVATGIGLCVAASMEAEWWVYVVTVAFVLLILYVVVTRV